MSDYDDALSISSCSIDNIDACQRIENQTILFRCSDNAGFASELNNLFRAFLYAIKNKRRFLIDDQLWNYGKISFYFNTSKGNFFHSFISTTDSSLENQMVSLDNRSHVTHLVITRDKDHSFSTLNSLMNPYETNVTEIISFKRKIARFFWNLRTERTKFLTEKLLNNLRIENIHYAMHIRRGDKIGNEAAPIPLIRYINAVEQLMIQHKRSNSSSFEIFVATDEPRIIEELRLFKPNWILIRLDFPSWILNEHKFGHFQWQFNRLPLIQKYQLTILLMSELEVLSRIPYVVCTFSSNICRFVHILRTQPYDSVISLDEKVWYPK